ncbi:MAG: DinB family protein [Terriglobales bacterium]
MSAHYELISRYERGIETFDKALEGVSPDLLNRAPAPGKWSIRQLAIHVAESEMVGCVRLRFIAAEPGSPLKAYDQDKWANLLGYEQQDPAQARALFRAVRQATAAMLRTLPLAAWENIGMHEERGAVSLREMVELLTRHAEHHSQQIRHLREQFASVA